jgi:hypothetical protein
MKKKIKTNIRLFMPDDMGLMWDQCKSGNLPLPSEASTDPAEFNKNLKRLIGMYNSHWIVEDDGEPVAAMFIKTDGWTIEPHVEFFAGTTPAAIFRSYLHFFGSLIKQGLKGSCIIKAFEGNKNLFDRLVKKGVLLYVGEIPEGDPNGTIYQYCLKPNRS